jgi:hypothetical protein
VQAEVQGSKWSGGGSGSGADVINKYRERAEATVAAKLIAETPEQRAKRLEKEKQKKEKVAKERAKREEVWIYSDLMFIYSNGT